MQTPIHTPDESASVLGAFICLVWLVILVWWLIAKSRVVADTVAWFRRKAVPARIFIACAFLAVLTYGSVKSGGNAPQGMGMRPPAASTVEPTRPEAASPSLAVVSVWTNCVALRPESTTAVEITAFRTVGGTELGDWIETAAPFFAVGTNAVSRCYVSASGSVSFETMRRPPVGSALPDGTGLPVLCPLRAPLGMVPEARWSMVFGQDEQDSQASGIGAVPVNPENPVNPVKGSRFWHDVLPGGGRVLTWENALVDRLPGRRVSFQVELHPSGDCVYRYDFHDCLDPPATNFVIGAQFGTNGVNALSILGMNILAATVWNVDGAPVTNGVSIADLLCTNGVLRTPSAFEIRWKNTTGLDPEADTDDDRLTDWEETFLWGTEAGFADTDGDGRCDGDEIAWGDDPFDADENGDGIPDGIASADWAANTLWAANADDAANLVITLNEATVAPATLIIGNLAIPLASPSSWSLRLEPGQMYNFRLHTQDNSPVDITLSPPSDEPVRSMPLRRDSPSSGNSAQSPLWQSPKDALNGPSGNTSGQIAVPKMEVLWVISHDGSHDTDSLGPCLHTDAPFTLFHPVVYPNGSGLGVDDIQLQGAERIGENIRLPVAAEPGSTAGAQVILPVDNFRWGYLECQLDAHRKDGGLGGSHCSICEMAGEHIDDVSLHVRSPLTLKHDNTAPIEFHCEKPDHAPASNPVIRIRRVGTTEWYTLAQSFSHLWTAKIAGFFELKGVATMDGETFETAPVVVEVQLPSYYDIAGDDTVLQLGQTLWNRVLEDCSETGRREHGCWIALDSTSDLYFGTSFRTGEWATASTTPGVQLPLKGFYDGESGIPPPTGTGAFYPVATIHAHTPTTYTVSGREVGPSEQDRRNLLLLAAPGIVLDYLPALDEMHPTATNRIPSGHPMEFPYRLYPVVPPDRRPTPP